jgi:hypothetical protein
VAGKCLPTWGENKRPFAEILHPWASSVLREEPEKQNSCFSPKPCQVLAHARARVGKIRFFDHPYNPRMQEQFSASGGKAVKLGPTSMRSTSPGPPSTCLKPRNTEIPLLPKSLSRGTARARARAKSRFFDHPYNPRMLTQESVTRTNPGKAGAKPEPGRANGSRNVRGSSPWPLGGLAAMGRMLGRLSKRFLLASPVWVRGAKRMGAIHRLWPVPPVMSARACVRGLQLRRVAVRCLLPDGYRRLSEIISREIAGNRRGTGDLTGWLVSLWR